MYLHWRVMGRCLSILVEQPVAVNIMPAIGEVHAVRSVITEDWNRTLFVRNEQSITRTFKSLKKSADSPLSTIWEE